MDDSKFSIVIPTMWRYSPFLDFLIKLVQHDLVAEIHIINNDFQKTPTETILNHPKIKMHNFALNIFVNPAWNYGVALSSNKKICVVNDDVDFNLSIFNNLNDKLKPGYFFVISPPPLGTPPQVEESFNILPCFEKPWQFGCLMFIHKDDWIDIPAGLEIFHGDTWIWDTMFLRYKNNFIIKGINFYTPHGVTSNSISNKDFLYLQRECKIYPVLLDNYRRKLELQNKPSVG